MVRKAKVSPITEASTYDDIAEAAETADTIPEEEAEVVEEIKNEIEPITETETIPEVKPKAKRISRAKREAPKAPVEQHEVPPAAEREASQAPEPEPEPEPERETPTAPKPKPKRVAKVRVVEQAEVLEVPPEKPKVARKPRVAKETQSATGSAPILPVTPVRVSRMAARENLYQFLVASALP